MVRVSVRVRVRVRVRDRVGVGIRSRVRVMDTIRVRVRSSPCDFASYGYGSYGSITGRLCTTAAATATITAMVVSPSSKLSTGS